MTTTAVPLHVADSEVCLPLVDVVVSGHDLFAFIVDTGASAVMVDQTLVADLSLPQADGDPHDGFRMGSSLFSVADPPGGDPHRGHRSTRPPGRHPRPHRDRAHRRR